MEGMEALGAFVENTRFGEFLRELFPGFWDMQASAVADDSVPSAEITENNTEEVVASSVLRDTNLFDIREPMPADYLHPVEYLTSMRNAMAADVRFLEALPRTPLEVAWTEEYKKALAVVEKELVRGEKADIAVAYAAVDDLKSSVVRAT